MQFETVKAAFARLRGVPVLRHLIQSIVARWYRFTGRRFTVSRVHGLLLLLDIDAVVDKRLAIWGEYEEPQFAFLSTLIAERRIERFFDIGSYGALYALRIHRAFPDIDIDAFEPQPQNRDQLRANLFLNGSPPSIRVHACALSDRNGTGHIRYATPRNKGGSRLVEAPADDTLPVETRRFDDLFDDSGRRAALKIDVEGHELRVIAGMHRYLAENDCVLQIESFPVNKDALISDLGAIGYRHVKTIFNDHYFERR